MAGFSALAIAPASAETLIKVTQGDDYAYLYQNSWYDIVYVCDVEADGHGVYVKVWKESGYDEFGDANGSASPCSSRSYSIGDVTSIQVCESVTGPDWCSDRRYR
ncbi:hypothetical protein AQJ58_22410 [Streptomyces sp. DSM 15324]|nr:hypothetical protein AQJ58_22410 [Streptomyces sp. DSM 15324]